MLGGASLFFCAIFLNREKVSCEEKNKRKMGQLFSQIGQQWKKVCHSTNALKFYGKFTTMLTAIVSDALSENPFVELF